MEQNHPTGKYMATVKIGAKGQIVIPKEARELFGLKEGDKLLLLADRNQGIALQPYEVAEAIFGMLNGGTPNEEGKQ